MQPTYTSYDTLRQKKKKLVYCQFELRKFKSSEKSDEKKSEVKLVGLRLSDMKFSDVQ